MRSNLESVAGGPSVLREPPVQPSIDVIMPVLNEAQGINAALSRVEQHAFDRVIVVDGGSVDATVELVRSWVGSDPNRSLVRSPPGRGAQMNLGASESDADVMLFLHCDCTLPRDAPRLVRHALSGRQNRAVAGAFVVRTVREGHPRIVRRLMWLAELRSRHTRYPYGDQAIFVRRDTYSAVGGFPEDPILEDLAFSRSVASRGAIARVDRAVVVSSRRFVGAPVRTGALMRLIPLLAGLGVPLDRLTALYPPVR